MLTSQVQSRHERNKSSQFNLGTFVGGSNNVEYEMANLESQPSSIASFDMSMKFKAGSLEQQINFEKTTQSSTIPTTMNKGGRKRIPSYVKGLPSKELERVSPEAVKPNNAFDMIQKRIKEAQMQQKQSYMTSDDHLPAD